MGLFDNMFKNNSSDKGDGKPDFWNQLSEINQIDEIIEESKNKPVLIFKDSTRCVISTMVLSQFEKAYNLAPEELKSYYLDLLSYRDISNALAEKFDVHHQSPQALLIKDGKCIYNASHNGIVFSEIKKQLS